MCEILKKILIINHKYNIIQCWYFKEYMDMPTNAYLICTQLFLAFNQALFWILSFPKIENLF